MATRPSKDELFIGIAYLLSSMTTCVRRGVGCVLTNSKNHILSTGYNGVASGQLHCNELGNACEGSERVASGKDLDKCLAIHAEQNALLQCRDVFNIHTCYSTTKPCVHCIKLLLNTSCERIVYVEEYSHSEASRIWLESGRELVRIPNFTAPFRARILGFLAEH